MNHGNNIKQFVNVSWLKYAGILMLFFSIGHPLFAHAVIKDLESMSKTQTATLYLIFGYKHVLPLGFDHILFMLSLFLLTPRLKPVLFQSLTFTVAHSITLCLAAYHVFVPPERIVEPLIALSIMYIALENIFSPKLKPSRLGVVFFFGLVHGMGFANALNSLGLPQDAFLSSLLMFNVGVELGQVTIILGAFIVLGKLFGNKLYYRKYIVIPLCILIAVVAAYWTIHRILF